MTETRSDGSPVRRLKGIKSPAPCWSCSRAMQGGRGQAVFVDGIMRTVHQACKLELFLDEDMAGRVTLAVPSS